MKKIFNLIVKKRLIFIILFTLLAITSSFLIQYVKISYDMTNYLDEDSYTGKSLSVMQEEFNSNGSFKILLKEIDATEASDLQKRISEMKYVSSVIFDADSENSYKDDNALLQVFLTVNGFTNEAKEVVNNTEAILIQEGLDYHMAGSTIESLYLAKSILNDLVIMMIAACLVVFVILLLNSISWIEPVIFIIVIAVAIFINLGTNAFLPSISFITQSICAIMQLALAMDYSIMLLHRYMQEKEQRPELPNEEIMKESLKETFLPIIGSSLTTVAGLLALACMEFKIGMDIGIVLSKGIIISLLCVFLFMPGIILLFNRLIDKTKHRNIYEIIKSKFPKGFIKFRKFQYKTRIVIPTIVLVLIGVGYYFYLQTDYLYTLDASNDPNSQINIDTKEIENVFGVQNDIAFLLPKGDGETEKNAINELANYTYKGNKVFTKIQSLNSYGLKDKYVASDVASIYKIDETLVNNIYKQMGLAKKHTLMEILEFISKDEYKFIKDYAEEYQGKIDTLYELSLKLDNKVDAKGLEEVLKMISPNMILNEENIQALINYLKKDITNFSEWTYKMLLDYIVKKDSLNKLIQEYEDFCLKSLNLDNNYTKEKVKEEFGFNDVDINVIFGVQTELSLREVIDNVISNNLQNKGTLYKDYEEVYKEANTSYTLSETLELNKYNYRIWPSILYPLLYGNKDTMTNYQIQSGLLTYVVSFIKETNDSMINYNGMIYLLEENLSEDDVATAFNVPSTIVSKLLEVTGQTSFTGKELLGSINANKLIYDENSSNTVCGRMIISFENTLEQANYALEMFESENYSRVVLNMPFKRSSDESLEITKELKTCLDEYYEDNSYLVVSESMAFVDFKDSFDKDSVMINLISFAFILIIIMISFRSLSIPLILTIIIQGAIWGTMAVNYFAGSSVYFICYLMIVCIQMGTTIDYGILYTSKYVNARKENDIMKSLEIAQDGSITTILTSGSILVIAAFIIGIVSQVAIISSIGYLLSVGTIVSLFFIILALPQILILSDKIIQKTTLKCTFKEENINE